MIAILVVKHYAVSRDLVFQISRQLPEGFFIHECAIRLLPKMASVVTEDEALRSAPALKVTFPGSDE